jgi:hypothetical protein
MSDEIRLALDAKRFRDQMDIEIHRTRQGHWHPGVVPCTSACPMGDPKRAMLFRRMIDEAMS